MQESNDNTYTPWMEGYEAALFKGVQPEECPYKDDPARADWLRGNEEGWWDRTTK